MAGRAEDGKGSPRPGTQRPCNLRAGAPRGMAHRLPDTESRSDIAMTDVSHSPSGLSAVDARWGGFTAGRAYLLVGRAGAGRSALALQTVRATTEADERALVISPREPSELVEVAKGVGLDLAAAHQAGRLRLLRIPSAKDLADRGVDGLAKSYRDLSELVAADRPARVVIEDFTPLVQFDTFDRFREAFQRLASDLNAQGVTLVIGLGEPGNEASHRLLEVVEEIVDGTVHMDVEGQISLRSGSSAPSRTEDAAPVQHADHASEPAGDVLASDAAPAPEPEASDASVATEPVEDEPVETDRIEDDLVEDEASSSDAPSIEVEEPTTPSTPASEPTSTPPVDPFALEPIGSDGDGFTTTFATANDSSGDSSAVAEPQPPTPEPEPEPEPAYEAESAHAEATPSTTEPGVPPPTDVIPPPPADASLLTPTGDAFGFDPADAIVSQGYLADSNGGHVAGSIQSQPATDAAPLPSFTPLGGSMPADPASTFRSDLEDAFASRASGTPFVVIALRMEPSSQEAAHFPIVEDAVRSGMMPGDR
ncbi:ATPase domain-containing protein, partial [Rubrivirga sp.]|uniref:RAD55 family ATPase n=1 Tax=Rubrivirga sp. TaxID=1885344 RepID=UPI003C76E8E3